MNKKQWAIIALILALVATNVTVAALFMNRDVTISGGVRTEGAIQVYDETGEAVMTTYDFPEFTSTSGTTYSKQFFVNNTGNVPVFVYWDIFNPIPASWSVAEGEDYYIFQENSNMKFRFTINKVDVPVGGTGYWQPTYSTGHGVSLGVGQGGKFSIDLYYNTTVNTAGDFSFVLSFSAHDA